MSFSLGATVLVLALVIHPAGMLQAQPAGTAEGIKQLEEWAQRLKSSQTSTLSEAEQEKLGSIVKAAKDWSPAEKLRGITTLVNMLTLAGARRLLLPFSGVYIRFILDGLEAVNDVQYRRYVINRDAGQSMEEVWTTLNAALRENYEIRYQFERLKRLLRNRTIAGVWRLEVSDKTIDELWDKREFTYKFTNLSNSRICDFSLVLHNDKVKGDVAGEMILNDNRAMPAGWEMKLGGNVIRFETNDPKACIDKNWFAEFTFRVWWKHFNEMGTVTAGASVLDRDGAHQGLKGSDIGEFHGPEAVSAPAGAAPEGSRVTLTGTVVEGQPAVASAVGPGGAVLTGVVVEVNGERKTTDEKGRVAFLVPAGAAALMVAFAGTPAAGPAYRSRVVPASGRPGAPAIQAATKYPSAGGELVIAGSSFAPQPGETTVWLGERELPVLAASPVELVASVPLDAPLGNPGSLRVRTPAGESNVVTVQVVRLRLDASRTRLIRGQRGKAEVVIEGTADSVPVTVTNASPTVVSMPGGNTRTTTSSGGAPNVVPVEFQTVGSGTFQIEAHIAEPPPAPRPSTAP